MRKWTWIIFIVAYTGALIVTVPASVLGTLVGMGSGGRLELANPDGTIWRGSANPLFHLKSGEFVTLPTLRWDVNLVTLTAGKLNVRLNWDVEMQNQTMDVAISPGQIELQHAFVPLPALLMEEAFELLKTAQLRGQLILRGDDLVLTRNGIQGTATLDWLNASSTLSSIAPLGNYHFIFSCSPSATEVTLNTTAGSLLLSGQGRLTTATGFNFNGSAQAKQGHEEPLKELLTHLGPEVRPGVHTFSLTPLRSN